MRVSPFGSLAFMLPEASRINSTERSALLQDWAQAVDANRSIARAGIAERFILFSIVGLDRNDVDPPRHSASPAVVEAMDETKDRALPPHSFE
jgi:hypothetical protein